MRSVLLILLSLISFVFPACIDVARARSETQRLKQALMSLTSPSVFIVPSDQAAAVAYYTRIQKKIGLPILDTGGTPVATLDQLVVYFGYQNLSAADSFSLRATKPICASARGRNRMTMLDG